MIDLGLLSGPLHQDPQAALDLGFYSHLQVDLVVHNHLEAL